MQKLLGNLEKGRLFVLSAPAGTGKTTLVQKLVSEFTSVIQSVSYTTREPRINEVQGVHYNFISREQFEQKIEEGELLEYVTLYGDYYGTSKKWVEEKENQGKHVILVIDTQGALLLKKKEPVPLIFVRPPSLQALKERLEKRQSETPERIQERLSWAKHEIEASQDYDYLIINDDLEVAYEALRSILIAEEHKNLE